MPCIVGNDTRSNGFLGVHCSHVCNALGNRLLRLHGAFGLDGGNSGVDILGDEITSVHETVSYVLTVTRITLDHHECGLESKNDAYSLIIQNQSRKASDQTNLILKFI